MTKEVLPTIDETKVDNSIELTKIEDGSVEVKSIDKSSPAAGTGIGDIPLHAWLILAVSSFGIFMASVSTSALVIAFPTVLVDLNMSISTMMWVLLVLLLMLATVVPTAGKLGDMFGQSHIYLVGYWIFVIGSLGAGFVNKSNQGYDLIAARVVIGFGAALLFTNSSVIITNAFSPFNKVGLAQGVFQVFSAMGIIFGPLIGGGFASTNWRWIFWYNAPVGGILAVMGTFILLDETKIKNNKSNKEFREQVLTFDFIGSFTCVCCFALFLIALVQAVVPNPVLSTPGALVGLTIGGAASGAIFLIDQYYAVNPLIPLTIFRNSIFCLTFTSTTAMAFVRNSITYNMIFFLQGPLDQKPLAAGISLIPFGVGIMVSGFLSGILTDKIGSRNMGMIGPLVCIIGVACLLVMDQNTSKAYVGGILFLTGLGYGIFQAPSGATNILSVPRDQRGVAVAVSNVGFAFSMMIGIVLTFSFVLNSMSETQLFGLFIYGASSTPDFPLRKMLDALETDYYIILAACGIAIISSFLLPSDLKNILVQLHAPPTVNMAGIEDSSRDIQYVIVKSASAVEINDINQDSTSSEHIVKIESPEEMV